MTDVLHCTDAIKKGITDLNDGLFSKKSEEKKDDSSIFDTNSDDKITSNDVLTQQMTSVFKALPTNKEDELKMQFDINHDGKIDEAEQKSYEIYIKEQKELELKMQFDIDKDGKIDEAEQIALDAYKKCITQKVKKDEKTTALIDETGKITGTFDESKLPDKFKDNDKVKAAAKALAKYKDQSVEDAIKEGLKANNPLYLALMTNGKANKDVLDFLDGLLGKKVEDILTSEPKYKMLTTAIESRRKAEEAEQLKEKIEAIQKNEALLQEKRNNLLNRAHKANDDDTLEKLRNYSDEELAAIFADFDFAHEMVTALHDGYNDAKSIGYLIVRLSLIGEKLAGTTDKFKDYRTNGLGHTFSDKEKDTYSYADIYMNYRGNTERRAAIVNLCADLPGYKDFRGKIHNL